MDDNHVTILLDIKEEIGCLSARMMDASRSRERMESNMDELKNSVAEIKPVVAIVSQMKPEHDDLVRFKQRVGSYVWLGGTIATGALYLLWQGLVFFSDRIGKMFH